jgi:sugar phosphate isomerase/epimerase
VRLGAMNHPMREVVDEIRTFHRLGFDFVDLTLEPERARANLVDLAVVGRVLADCGMGVVGHTAWYLPIASPFASLRQAARDEMIRCFDAFARLGVDRVNVHPDPSRSMFARDAVLDLNAAVLRQLAEQAEGRGMRLMLENTPGYFGRVDVLQRLFDAVPALGWHLDVGHANLNVPANVSGPLLDAFASRLCHVHLSDNKGGGDDLHLPIGTGNIDWPGVIGLLKRAGYDGTITLEVFSPDHDYLALSRQKVRALWDAPT